MYLQAAPPWASLSKRPASPVHGHAAYAVPASMPTLDLGNAVTRMTVRAAADIGGGVPGGAGGGAGRRSRVKAGGGGRRPVGLAAPRPPRCLLLPVNGCCTVPAARPLWSQTAAVECFLWKREPHDAIRVAAYILPTRLLSRPCTNPECRRRQAVAVVAAPRGPPASAPKTLNDISRTKTPHITTTPHIPQAGSYGGR